MIEGLGNTKATARPLAATAFVRSAAALCAVVFTLLGSAGAVFAGSAGAPSAQPAPAPDAVSPAEASQAEQKKPDAPSAQPAEASIYDRIWGYARLYNNPDNRWIQELSIVGREQVDWYHFDGEHSGENSTADNFVNRRTRIGFKSKVFKTFTVHSEVDLNLEGDGEVYNKLTDAYVKWSPDKRFNVTVGKHGAKFTLDGGTSSTSLITIDRSNIANNFWFPEEYMPGVSFNGDVGKWSYNAGYFTSGDANSEFGDFSAGSFLLLSGGYDFGEMLDSKKAAVRFDYVYQDPNAGNDFTRANEHVVSLNGQYEKGRWGLSADVDYANGYGGQPDMVGGQITPSVTFCETWQGVVRYTGINSDGHNGIRPARYENRIETGRGDEYNEIYLGLNKYFYGHKLKWQTGIQYADMKDAADDGGDYSGWGVTTGLRMFW